MMSSEFQTWESLYWPEHVPRTSPPAPFTPTGVLKLNSGWRFQSKGYSVTSHNFAELVERLTRSLTQNEQVSSFAITASDPLAIFVGAAVAFTSSISTEILFDPLKSSRSSLLELDQIDSSHNALEDLGLKKLDGASSSWTPSEPSISLTFPEDIRVTYSHQDLWDAVESFLAFSNLRSESGIAVIGSPRHEYGFFIGVSALIAGIPLIMIDDFAPLQSLPFRVSAVFVDRKSIGSVQTHSLENCGRALRSLGNSLNYVGIDGPMNSKFTKGLEKSCGAPVLQMYGISGRGIVLSSPREFNVHGSVGIPITNAEAVIGDNYEGNWMRDRLLMGPASEGELLIRGTFVNQARDVGDAKQNLVKLGVLDQSTEWITTGITGKMDENGYFYLESASLR